MVSKTISNIMRVAGTIIAILLLLILTANKVGLGKTNDPATEITVENSAADGTPYQPPSEDNSALSASSARPADTDKDTETAGDIASGSITSDNNADASGNNVLNAAHTALSSEARDDGTTAAQPGDETGEQPEEQPTTANVVNSYEGVKIAYITIDDGPTRAITPGMLDILAQEGVKATFFVLPHSGVDDIYKRIIDEGHEIGNHSYSHVYSRLYSSGDLETFREDVLKARDYILDNFGYLTTTFRFPGGMMGRSSAIVAPRCEILDELGYRYFDWNSDTGDANRNPDKSATGLTNNVLRNTNGRERLIIIMHDTSDKRTTLEALPRIIAGLREQGYVFDILRNYDDPHPGAASAAAPAATPTSLS